MVQLSPGAPAIEVLDLPAVDGAGAGAPLVLLHEGLGSVGLWRDFPQALRVATGRRVVAFSRHGHGASDPPAVPRTPAFHQQEALEVVPALLQSLGIAQPVLVGHSDGASIAIIHAAHHAATALVLIAPHVFVEEQTVRGIRETRDEYVHGDLRTRMARRHADPDAAFWGWCDVWLDPAFRDWNLDAEAAAITVPTLLVQGDEDPYGTLKQLERIEERMLGRSERAVIGGGGHSPHREHRDWLVARVAAFLSLTSD